jgi:hypothetical protein
MYSFRRRNVSRSDVFRRNNVKPVSVLIFTKSAAGETSGAVAGGETQQLDEARGVGDIGGEQEPEPRPEHFRLARGCSGRTYASGLDLVEPETFKLSRWKDKVLRKTITTKKMSFLSTVTSNLAPRLLI